MDDADTVDDAVGELGRDDLFAKLMMRDGLREIALHLRREGRREVVRQRRIVRQVALLDRVLERELRRR
jgi:hypothetical protein